MIASAGLIYFFRNNHAAESASELSVPDWSITYAATQMSNAAIAVSAVLVVWSAPMTITQLPFPV